MDLNEGRYEGSVCYFFSQTISTSTTEFTYRYTYIQYIHTEWPKKHVQYTLWHVKYMSMCIHFLGHSVYIYIYTHIYIYIRVRSFTELRLLFPQSLLHCQHNYSTFPWKAACQSSETPHWRIGAFTPAVVLYSASSTNWGPSECILQTEVWEF
jgi:hypothetical protein